MERREIRLMPSWLRNQIAAGEVVERPSSVVKELLENAIDADASNVRVEITGGGLKSIKVQDDGWGMDSRNLELSLARHATSKIYGLEDMDRISTLGFRGEALPSIASICKLTLRSRPRDALAGEEIVTQGGQQFVRKPAGMPPGTEIIVEDLFFNTPARKKFMRSCATETARVSEIIQSLALANPALGVVFISDGKKLLGLPSGQEILDRIWGVLGKDLCESLWECREGGRILINGFISGPDFSRSNRNSLYLFVNRRYVKDRLLNQALLSAYSGLLPSGRFPAAVLNITVPHSLVDVNVHPSKTEVRFSAPQEIFAILSRAVSLTLKDASSAGQKSPVIPSSTYGSPNKNFSKQPGISWGLPGNESYGPVIEKNSILDVIRDTNANEQSFATQTQALDEAVYIGAFLSTYLMFEQGDNLIVMDQHAAHEALLFAEFSKAWLEGAIVSQPLLFPVSLDLSPGEISNLMSGQDVLEGFGIQMERFGEKTVLVRAVPGDIPSTSVKELIGIAASEIGQIQARNAQLNPAVHKVLATMACKAACKAGEQTAPQVARNLLNMVRKKETWHCPHGRPVMQVLSRSWLEKIFKR